MYTMKYSQGKVKHFSTDNTGTIAFVMKCQYLILYRSRMKEDGTKEKFEYAFLTCVVKLKIHSFIT